MGVRTRLDYEKRLRLFDEHCVRAALPLVSIPDIEKALLEFFDWAYLSGQPLDAGTKLLAAVGARWPHLHKTSLGLLLARARRALQGWARLDPPRTRLPLPWPVLSGLSVLLVLSGIWDFAMLILLAADAYLRPGELAMLTPDNVVRPRPSLGPIFQHAALLLFPYAEGIASKTHQFDDSVVLDSVGREWLTAGLLRLVARRAPRQALLDGRAPALRLALSRMASLLGLESWQLSPFVLRHTGPSHDHLSHLRSLPEIKHRGHWASDTSLRRYEKSSQVTARLESLPEKTLAFLQRADAEIPDLIGKKARPSDELPRLAARATGGKLLLSSSRSSAAVADSLALSASVAGVLKSGTSVMVPATT